MFGYFVFNLTVVDTEKETLWFVTLALFTCPIILVASWLANKVKHVHWTI